MADSKISALTAVGTPALTDEIAVNQGGTSKKLTVQQIADLMQKRISGSSGAAGPYKTLQRLSSNAGANSTTTLATVMTTTGLQPGTYTFKYHIVYQSGATTTGVDFALAFATGTVTKVVMQTVFITTGGAAAAGTATQATTATPNLAEGKAARALATKVGASIGVDTLNANMLVTLEGVLVVSVAGDLQLQHASEVAAASTVQADTCLELTKVA